MKRKFSDSLITDVMKEIGYDDQEIEDKLYEHNIFKGWTPITVKELQEMDENKQKELFSFCWHDGQVRCDTIGIRNLKIENSGNGWRINWSDMNGDPTIYVSNLDTLLDNFGDGEWNYGLYKKI